MEKYLLFIWGNVANIEGVCDFTFMSPNSAILLDSCDYIGHQI